ncbi:MAG: hypothetical protein KDD37_02255 [Bdellovibrionales bacterium]|nr:hypothetical protein [Bdellovibrionales bacterium]
MDNTISIKNVESQIDEMIRGQQTLIRNMEARMQELAEVIEQKELIIANQMSLIRELRQELLRLKKL